MLDEITLPDRPARQPEPFASPTPPPAFPSSEEKISARLRLQRSLLDACAVSDLANSLMTYDTAGMSNVVLFDFAMAGFFMGMRALADTKIGKHLRPQYSYYVQASVQAGNAAYLIYQYHSGQLPPGTDIAQTISYIALFLLSSYGNFTLAEPDSTRQALLARVHRRLTGQEPLPKTRAAVAHYLTQAAFWTAFGFNTLIGTNGTSLAPSFLAETAEARRARRYWMTAPLRKPVPRALAATGSVLNQGYFLATLMFILGVGNSTLAKTIFLGNGLAHVLLKPNALMPEIPGVLFAGAFAAGALRCGWEACFSAVNSNSAQSLEAMALGAALLSMTFFKNAHHIYHGIMYGIMRITAACDYPARNPLSFLFRKAGAESALPHSTAKKKMPQRLTARIGDVFHRAGQTACILLNPKSPTSFPVIASIGCLVGSVDYLIQTPNLLSGATLAASMVLYAQAAQSITFRDDPLKIWGLAWRTFRTPDHATLQPG